MAQEQHQPGDYISLPVAADYSADQFTFMKLDTNGRAAQTAATTDHPIGILLNDPDAIDQEGEIMVAPGRICKLLVDGNSVNIAIGDKLGTTSAGQGYKVTSAEYHAVAMEAATADDVVIGVIYVGTREV
jgi:hypothetical protein